MAEEKIFENKIKDFLKSLPDTWFFKHWAGAYSPKGIPDIIGCVKGRFIGVEVKASNGKPSPLQIRNIDLINKSGGYGVILYPKDFDKFKEEIINILKES
ncbi:VRR-NUC domain-containing protein [Clostridium chromiireducens]|uniref:VRR-NUC domain-containing protein n=1 Tax=Clostridium chromiireducens TaxID=225345 RepID=UPI003AF6B0AB